MPERALRRRLGGFALNALLVLLATAVALGGLELLLRARPTLLGADFANGVLSKYTDGEGGIFYEDRQAQGRFMIPNLTAQMYYNGYLWTHRTGRPRVPERGGGHPRGQRGHRPAGRLADLWSRRRLRVDGGRHPRAPDGPDRGESRATGRLSSPAGLPGVGIRAHAAPSLCLLLLLRERPRRSPRLPGRRRHAGLHRPAAGAD